MSAWSLGRTVVTPVVPDDAAPGGADTTLKGYVDKITNWIPGDVLAIYVASVTAQAGQDATNSSPLFLAIMAVVTPLVVILGRFSTGQPITRTIGVRGGLAFVAFLIWSLTVPLSGWRSWDVVSNNATMISIIAAVAGLLFGLAADGIMARMPADS